MRRSRTAARAPAPLALHTLLLALLTAAAAQPQPTPDTLAALGAILPPFVSEHFDELVKAASASCEAIPQQLLFARTSPLQASGAPLLRYSRGGRRALSATRAAERVRRGEPLVLYVPGWWNTPSDASSHALVQALMTKHSAVHLLDTRLFFCRGYVTAVSNITPLSHTLFNFFKKLHKSGYPLSSIHIIGFSLGAHVAGLTGKLVKRNLNATLGRITALDPARPCFARGEYRLDKEDAAFVQVIHSSTGVLGIAEPLGHADVYVNGVGGKHPECAGRSISLECDHARAWQLYSASAMNELSLMGRRCASWDELLHEQCSGSETVLGYSCSPTAQGMFLFKSQENSEPQFRERELHVFNLFNLLSWPFRSWQSSKLKETSKVPN
ncbi:hypothetical protein PYW08_007393 [Mythimna loreyi]|uniref:Uncharacterized protein n=1 Tax=Mythimna loreyi TaxID=667449 RepID=A0ACC2QDH5_9NEOP|nr:hypothetical protein PYW08_007393 [Mythimna loreyi]